MPTSVSGRQRVQPILAVDQRTRTGGAELVVRQAQFGQQRRHFGSAHHERLGADIDGDSADQLGAQHAAEPVGRVEQRDGRVVTGALPQPVGRGQARDPAADNTIRASHSEWTSATRSVRIAGIGLRQHSVAEVEDVPGRAGVHGAPSVVDHRARRLLDRRPARQQHHRIEVALQRFSGFDAGGGIDQRGPPVDPDDRAHRPASTWRPAARRCPPRSASSARRGRPAWRTPANCAAARTAGSRPATARPPTNRTPGSHPPRRRVVPAGNRWSGRPASSISACQHAGSASIIALVRAWLRLGPPSTR